MFGESFAHDIADIENPQASLLYRWVIRDHDKLLPTYDGRPGKMKYPPTGGAPQLFDLENDPKEESNLATDNPNRVRELSALLDGWYPVSQRQIGKVAPAKEAGGSSLVDNISPTFDSNIRVVYSLIAGGGAGFSQGRHLIMEKDTPFYNLWQSQLTGCGIESNSIGNSHGMIEELFSV